MIIFFVKTNGLELPSLLAPQTLRDVIRRSDRLDWIVNSLNEDLTDTDNILLQTSGYESFLLYQPPFAEPLIGWAKV